MSDPILHKWALYIHRKSKQSRKHWPVVWLLCSIILIYLYSLHKTGSILVGAVIFIFAATMWTERRAFSEIIDEKDKRIEALKANKENDEEKELPNKAL